MVKNAGGNKSKRQARKYASVPQNRDLRFRNDPCEMYAIVTKLYGGANTSVLCMDSTERHCIIRNKFRGRDKRDNTIAPGVWVLVGLREWEARSDKPQKCDLLEVYNQNEKEKLKNTVKDEVLELIKNDEHETNNEEMCGIKFEDQGNSNIMEETETHTCDPGNAEYDSDIDIDEI